MGLYDVEKKAFTGTILEQPLEVTSLIGSVTEMDGKPYLHVHIGVADVAGKAYGGHLKKCVIGGTAEIFIQAADGKKKSILWGSLSPSGDKLPQRSNINYPRGLTQTTQEV